MNNCVRKIIIDSMKDISLKNYATLSQKAEKTNDRSLFFTKFLIIFITC